MKEEKSFTALIYYLVFIFIEKIYDLFISIKYPKQENVLSDHIGDVELRKIIIRFRTLFSLISLFWLFYLVKNYKFNTNIYLLFTFIFSSIVFYLLFEKRVIYFIFDKEKLDSKFIDTLDSKGGVIINTIYFFIYFYLMYKLFARNN